MPTTRGTKRRYNPKGARYKTKRAGIKGLGYTRRIARAHIRANRLNMIVVDGQSLHVGI